MSERCGGVLKAKGGVEGLITQRGESILDVIGLWVSMLVVIVVLTEGRRPLQVVKRERLGLGIGIVWVLHLLAWWAIS